MFIIIFADMCSTYLGVVLFLGLVSTSDIRGSGVGQSEV